MDLDESCSLGLKSCDVEKLHRIRNTKNKPVGLGTATCFLNLQSRSLTGGIYLYQNILKHSKNCRLPRPYNH